MPSIVSASSLRAPLALSRKSAAYVRKNYRYFVRDPHFFWMKTAARFELMREWASKSASSDARELGLPPSAVLQSDRDLFGIHRTLSDEGYFVGLKLAPDVLDELLELARGSLCFGDRDPNLKLRIDQRGELEARLGRGLKLASYFNQQEDWPVFQRLKNDPWLRAIALAYLGCEPVHLRSELAWSFPYPASHAEKRAAAQVLHCDINDFKTLKFFFYLTDVGPKNGPHAYIKKNPVARTMKHQLLGQRCASLPEQQLLDTYGENQLVTVCGPAGLGFVGDPYYFHRGMVPEEGARLLLQIEVGCRRYRTWYFDF